MVEALVDAVGLELLECAREIGREPSVEAHGWLTGRTRNEERGSGTLWMPRTSGPPGSSVLVPRSVFLIPLTLSRKLPSPLLHS
jgi:hypothetical protein